MSIWLFSTLLPVFGAEPGDMVRALRLKLSSGDLASAESILEVYRAENGSEGEYLTGLAWLARGAATLGAWKDAAVYAQQTRSLATPLLKTPAAFQESPQAAYALGTAIDVEAQYQNHTSGKLAALQFLEKEVQSHAETPVAFRSRIWRRWNMLDLTGRPAPVFKSETSLGPAFKSIAEMQGKPFVLFFWANWCPDCKAQAAALAKVVKKYQARGVQFLAVTRFYETDQDKELQQTKQVWHDAYAGLESVPIAVSEQGMMRYGASSTPTFVFVDRAGRVRSYAPTRMTESRLSAAIDDLLP